MLSFAISLGSLFTSLCVSLHPLRSKFIGPYFSEKAFWAWSFSLPKASPFPHWSKVCGSAAKAQHQRQTHCSRKARGYPQGQRPSRRSSCCCWLRLAENQSGSLLWQSYALHQHNDAWIGSKVIELRIDLQVNHISIVVVVRLLKPD